MILPPKKVPAFGSKFAFTSESKGYKKKILRTQSQAWRETKVYEEIWQNELHHQFFFISGTDLHILLTPRKTECASKGFLTDCPVWHEMIEALQPTSTSSIQGRTFLPCCVRCNSNKQVTVFSIYDTLFKPESQYPIVDIALPFQIQF